MKICFSFQRSFASISHHLAVLLHERNPSVLFCGYIQLRSNLDFLKEQKDIAYTKLILDEDIHEEFSTEPLDPSYLSHLEREYGIPNLWPYIALDRVLMFNQLIREYPYNTPAYSHEEMLRIFQVKTKAVIAFMEQEKPDAIFFPNMGNISMYFMYQYAKKHNIKTLFVSTASTKNCFVLSETYDSFTGVNELFKKRSESGTDYASYKKAQVLLAEFREKPNTYNKEMTAERQPMTRGQQFRFLQPRRFIASVRWFTHLLYVHFFTRYRKDYSYVHPVGYLVDHTKRKIRNLIGTADLYDPMVPGEDFTFFPLHYEPEISLLLLAPFTTNQIELIRQTAQSLPITHRLYVKEHPLMVQYRPRAYYREIKKIPNVKLINPSVSATEIARHAKLIVTVTGSALWEGLMLGKPGIAFGHQFYNILSMVKKVTDPERLPFLVKEQLEHFTYQEEELTHFLAAIIDDSATLDLYHLWEQEGDAKKKRTELQPLAQLLARKLNLQ